MAVEVAALLMRLSGLHVVSLRRDYSTLDCTYPSVYIYSASLAGDRREKGSSDVSWYTGLADLSLSTRSGVIDLLGDWQSPIDGDSWQIMFSRSCRMEERCFGVCGCSGEDIRDYACRYRFDSFFSLLSIVGTLSFSIDIGNS